MNNKSKTVIKLITLLCDTHYDKNNCKNKATFNNNFLFENIEYDNNHNFLICFNCFPPITISIVLIIKNPKRIVHLY